ncbi:MAG TPA: APC family permease [Candidatus Limnocylindrales bacterium]
MSAEETPPDAPSLKRGVKPGDRRAVVARPEARYFRYGPAGTMVAKAAAIEPQTLPGRVGFGARRVLFGRVLSSDEELGQRLPKWKALPVFSSDVMSSVAYAGEASMFTLVAAGSAAFVYLMPISFLIVALLVVVTFSYRQTIRAYPNGGGSYIVAHSNLGVLPGLVAAASLLVDYVLTVSVSVSSGVYNLASALPFLAGLEVPIIVICILLVMTVNLRGLSESGTIFALPTYIFLGSMLLMIGLGFVRTLMGQHLTAPPIVPIQASVEGVTLLILMRAFADGCSAMTGTEAVANGVPAFKPPEWKNAQKTMLAMSLLLGSMFLGMSWLIGVTGAQPSASGDSVLSQIGAAVFWGRTPLYYLLIFSTMGVLVLAAQTSFADFPRLSSILAHDGFFPRQFAFRGERLAFNAGIIALALLSAGLVIAFAGDVNRLIPLYAIGVFTSFTLSQSGMVHHWWVERGSGWRRSIAINAVGAAVTAVVVVIFAIAKFALGAWIVLIIVPVLVVAMLFIRREYRGAELELYVRDDTVIGRPSRRQRVVVPMQEMRRDVIQAIKFGLTMSDDVVAVHVTDDLVAAEELRERFRRQVPDVELVIVESPYRELVQPLIRYLEVTSARHADAVTIVLVPERIIHHWWERFLYNQNAHRIRDALTGHPGILVADIPFRQFD